MKPASRFREPFLPLSPLPARQRALTAFERWVKGIAFNCSMCGNCLLQETAYICPLLCPKGLRNGPCGSGSAEACCVAPSRPCIWHHIYERAEALGTLDRLLEVQAPLDWNQVGKQTWGAVLSAARARGLLSLPRRFSRPSWREEADRMFKEIRQPAWWGGDSAYHPPASSRPVSLLQIALERGDFVFTAELSPPRGSRAGEIREAAANLRGLVDAVNVTQNPMASPRMASLACSALLIGEGIEPVMQLTARDYNRLVLQSETIGASALGIHNILCLTGDPPTEGPGPAGLLPFDLDATQMLWILRRMRDEGYSLDGRALPHPPSFFLGSAASPNDLNFEHEAMRLEKKINAGAQFIQTQLVFDTQRLERWLEALDARDLLGKAHILVGVGPLRSVKAARYLQRHIPDVEVPQSIVDRLARSDRPESVGLEIALELIDTVRALPGVSGIHLMGMGQESILPALLAAARPKRTP